MEMNSVTSARETQLQHWLLTFSPEPIITLSLLAGDASFRRYYRATTKSNHFIVMDAPPSHEDCRPFVALDAALRVHRVLAPEIIAQDLKLGFLLLSDFGDTLYESVLNLKTADHFYHMAFNTLLKMQAIKSVSNYDLPLYDDAKLRFEMQLFTDWYFEGLCEKKCDLNQQKILADVFNLLIQSAKEQPYVFVHRDYHCRNLMALPNDEVGVLDFQDAVWGPITYDLVSLLRDCYIDWPKDKLRDWVFIYHQALIDNKLMPSAITTDTFLRWFDWMGLQRHLKCMGIFSRLHLRDKKPVYLQSIPRVLTYAREVANRYDELKPLLELLK